MCPRGDSTAAVCHRSDAARGARKQLESDVASNISRHARLYVQLADGPRLADSRASDAKRNQEGVDVKQRKTSENDLELLLQSLAAAAAILVLAALSTV